MTPGKNLKMHEHELKDCKMIAKLFRYRLRMAKTPAVGFVVFAVAQHGSVLDHGFLSDIFMSLMRIHLSINHGGMISNWLDCCTDEAKSYLLHLTHGSFGSMDQIYRSWMICRSMEIDTSS